jgi:hypothetical protein
LEFQSVSELSRVVQGWDVLLVVRRSLPVAVRVQVVESLHNTLQAEKVVRARRLVRDPDGEALQEFDLDRARGVSNHGREMGAIGGAEDENDG